MPVLTGNLITNLIKFTKQVKRMQNGFWIKMCMLLSNYRLIMILVQCKGVKFIFSTFILSIPTFYFPYFVKESNGICQNFNLSFLEEFGFFLTSAENCTFSYEFDSWAEKKYFPYKIRKIFLLQLYVITSFPALFLVWKLTLFRTSEEKKPHYI